MKLADPLSYLARIAYCKIPIGTRRFVPILTWPVPVFSLMKAYLRSQYISLGPICLCIRSLENCQNIRNFSVLSLVKGDPPPYGLIYYCIIRLFRYVLFISYHYITIRLCFTSFIWLSGQFTYIKKKLCLRMISACPFLMIEDYWLIADFEYYIRL